MSGLHAFDNVLRIDSLDDARVSLYRSLGDPGALRGAGIFVAEGRLVVRRLLASRRFTTRSLLVTETALRALGEEPLPAASGVPIFVVTQEMMNAIVGFNIHRGCLALADRPAPQPLSDLPLATLARLVVMEGVNNPDNVGGIFRSAAAFGIDAVVLGPACGDPLYRKAVRTSMAATLTVPFVEAGPWPGALDTLRLAGLRVLALTPVSDAMRLDRIPRDLARVAVLVGAEGEGLSAGALQGADQRVRIPMAGAADSLNVTVAASIAMSHFCRRESRDLKCAVPNAPR